MITIKIKLTLPVLLLMAVATVSGQRSSVFDDPVSSFHDGVELFMKEKFTAAHKRFTQVLAILPADPANETVASASYYKAMCAVALYNDNAEYEVLQFAEKYPANPQLFDAYFQLANNLYSRKRYKQAIEYYELIRDNHFNNERLGQYYFNLGYAYFKTEDYVSAENTFFELKNSEGPYAIPSKYYFGHCAYMNKNYETALQSLEQLVADENFGPIVPYYITQIYYEQGLYEKLLEVALPLFEQVVARRAPEVAKLIGESYYMTGQYKESIQYLEMYEKTSMPFGKQDAYELGYAYYITGEYNRAIEYFKQVTYHYDSLSQNAYFHMANCYLKLGNKKMALNTYMMAHLPYDQLIQEDALFQYAKLSYDLQYNPYNEAINAFEKYLAYYPGSERIPTVNRYLVDLYLTTRNYKDALVSISKIEDMDFKMKVALQKITFFRGVELFNNYQYTEASELFRLALGYRYNNTYSALSTYWLAESFFRQEQFDSSIVNYNKFLLSAGAFSSNVYQYAYYNLGYAYFKRKDYENARKAFYNYTLATTGSDDQRVANDAYLRLADCYFVRKDYEKANEYYQRVINNNKTDADYALFQKALAQGVLSDYNGKVETLIELLKRFPASAYADDAKFQLADICFVLEKYDMALKYYKKIVDEYPESSYLQKSLLQIGLIQFNTDNYEESLETFKHVVKSYPGTSASKEALVSIKNIYMEMDRVEDFFLFVKGVSTASVSSAEQDSITYMTIENKYFEGDCERAINGFRGYIEKFPDGYFVANAHYYKAECEYKAGAMLDALKGYTFIADYKIKSKFTENAVLKAATISFDQKHYPEAIKRYLQLEVFADYKSNMQIARIGLMRSYFLSGDADHAIKAADAVLKTDKVNQDIIQEAHMVKARSAMKLNNTGLALGELKSVTDLMNNALSAEARYLMAYLKFQEGQYAESERLVFELINHVPSFDYWIAKGFILLGDNYVRTDNVFQAKHTWKSIIDNYEGADLVAVAQAKLDSVLEVKRLEELRRADEERIRREALEAERKKQQELDELLLMQGVKEDTLKVHLELFAPMPDVQPARELQPPGQVTPIDGPADLPTSE